jgi:hypothetical protein
LLRIYCIFNKRKLTAFATELFEKELADFKETLAKLRDVNPK